mgnify:CR=1 FL=1
MTSSLLHIINKSPSHRCFSDCLRTCSKGNSIILIEDGVYATAQWSSQFLATTKDQSLNVYALEADMRARGLSTQHQNGLNIIDDKGFVELTLSHSKSQSWF